MKCSLPVLLVLAILPLTFIPPLARAATIQLPQTGQTTCIDAAGAVIACQGTGQDGDIRAGIPLPSPRFVDNADGTVTDNLTGLVWLKDANCFGTKLWKDALTAANTLKGDGTQCSLNDGSVAGDWRLPNFNELKSLLDRGQYPMIAPGSPFTGIAASYWSSSSAIDTWFGIYNSSAWVATSYYGYTLADAYQNFNNVWPVRDGQAGVVQLPKTGQTTCLDGTSTIACAGTGQDGDTLRGVDLPTVRFTNNGNGTVTDNLTGLIWLQNANCKADPYGFWSQAKEGTLSWTDAMAWSNGLKSGDCGLADGSLAGDWRLPNITELQSLVDITAKSAPPLPSEAFSKFTNIWRDVFTSPYYWSSTNDVKSGAFMMGIYNGSINNSQIRSDFLYHAWPVRGGLLGGATMTVFPGARDFGILAPGESASQVVTISNTGSTTRLQVGAITLSGTDAGEFVLNVGNGTNGTCGSTMPIIAPGAYCTVTVSFSPATTGTKSAALSISTAQLSTVALSGTSLVNGVCGTANGGLFNTAPSTNLCVSGTTSAMNGTGPWTWDCTGGGGGTSASCSANISTNTVTFSPGAHGSLTGVASQVVKYGDTATTVTAIPDPDSVFVNWTEGATVVGSSASLTAVNIIAAHNYTANFALLNGTCGTSNGTTLPVAPTSNLCAGGTATPLSGTGPWNWQCVSAYGGTTANCSANIRTYTVTPTAGTSTTISPATPLTVNHGGKATFTITAPAGYGITGTGCGGTLNGTTYTTGTVTADCTVSVNAVRRTADSTGAGQPTIQDALRTLLAYNGKVQLSSAEKILYDVAPLGSNGLPVGNGIVDYADIIMIMRRIVGIGSW